MLAPINSMANTIPDSNSFTLRLSTPPKIFGSTKETTITSEKLAKKSENLSNCLSFSSGKISINFLLISPLQL